MNNCFTSCTPLAWLCLLNISWKRQTACFTFQASFLKETLLTIPFLKVWATTYHTEYLRHLKPQKRKLDKCFNSYVCTSNEADHWLCLLIFCKQCMDKRRTMNEEKVGFISYKLYFDGNVGAKNCSFPILFLWGELGIGDLEISWIHWSAPSERCMVCWTSKEGANLWCVVGGACLLFDLHLDLVVGPTFWQPLSMAILSCHVSAWNLARLKRLKRFFIPEYFRALFFESGHL